MSVPVRPCHVRTWPPGRLRNDREHFPFLSSKKAFAPEGFSRQQGRGPWGTLNFPLPKKTKAFNMTECGDKTAREVEGLDNQ